MKHAIRTLTTLLLTLAITACANPNQPLTGPFDVDRIVDGDTARIWIDGTSESVRLLNIDSPETVHPSRPVERFGSQARDHAKALVDGKRVYLAFDVQRRDHYGRLLAIVYAPHPQGTYLIGGEPHVTVNEQIALQGLADVLVIPPNVTYADTIRAAVTRAREAGRGMWSQ